MRDVNNDVGIVPSTSNPNIPDYMNNPQIVNLMSRNRTPVQSNIFQNPNTLPVVTNIIPSRISSAPPPTEAAPRLTISNNSVPSNLIEATVSAPKSVMTTIFGNKPKQ